MTEEQAIRIAWSAIDGAELRSQVSGVKSTSLSRAEEVRELFDCENLPLRDKWYVSFLLRLEDGVISQHPDSIVIAVDAETTEPEFVDLM